MLGPVQNRESVIHPIGGQPTFQQSLGVHHKAPSAITSCSCTDPLAAMLHRFQTPEGKKQYALRKHTPEPVFGII
jgi:hypothetical protein